MDTFLRRVLAQRELQQEAEAVAAEPSEMFVRQCRLCGGYVRQHEKQEAPLTVCTACGGRKRQARLEREDAVVNRRSAFRGQLLSLIHSKQEVLMARECTKCHMPLHARTKGEVCRSCRASAGSEDAAPPRVASAGARRGKDVRKRYRVLTDALGINGDKLLEEFMQGWIDRIRASVPKPDEDDERTLQAVNE